MRAVRKQSDTEQDGYSLLTGLDCSDLPDMTRQEFKDEADINNLMTRYGVTGAPQRPTVFGEVDYDQDLQQAKQALHDAQRAWEHLPQNIKEKYRGWRSLFTAIENGTFEMPAETPAEPIPEAQPKA